SQKIASTVWKAMKDVIFKGTKAHFKPYGMLRSVEGKSNKTGSIGMDYSFQFVFVRMIYL
ncbi:hypothetical protein, partial [Bacillus thuringiensis]